MKRGFKKNGMALVLVLSLCMALLVLGSSYVKTLSNVKTTNPKVLEKIQADFFGQGIMKIAIFKFKKYPSQFYDAVLYDAAPASSTFPALNPATPLPIVSYRDAAGSILQNLPANLASPPILSYSTDFRLISHKAYEKDGLEITVKVRTGTSTSSLDRFYKATLDASRNRIL